MKGTGLNTASFSFTQPFSSFPQVLCYSQSPLSHTISFILLPRKLSCCNSRPSVEKSQFPAVWPTCGCHRIPQQAPEKCALCSRSTSCLSKSARQAKPVATVGLIFICAFQNPGLSFNINEEKIHQVNYQNYQHSATLFLWSCDFERNLVMDLWQEFGFYLNNLAGILMHIPQHETSLW